MGNYSKLGTLMGQFPELAIFRRHSNLNTQNILFFQAELARLEDDLKELREEDETSGDPEKQDNHKQWSALSRVNDKGEPSEQYQKFLQIRSVLKEYNDALLQHHELCKLHRPTKTDLRSLRYWLDNKEGGDCFLREFEADAWEQDRPDLQQDLITMSDHHRQRDVFSAWIADDVMAWIQRTFGSWRKKSADIEAVTAGMYNYSDGKLNALSHFIGTLIASLLPAMSIFVLYFVHDMLTRLGAIMAFSALFSFTLAIFTRAKRIEIFAATAAFASVQVVFVGQPGSTSASAGAMMG